jgi:hypothetical protein
LLPVFSKQKGNRACMKQAKNPLSIKSEKEKETSICWK